MTFRQRLRRPSRMTKAPASTANALPLVAGSISGVDGNGGPAAIPMIAVPIASNTTAEKTLTDPFPPLTLFVLLVTTIQIVREGTSQVKTE